MREGRLKSHYSNVRGLSMHALVSIEPLPKEAKAIVLVHGAVISSRYMVPTAKLLAPDYRVFAPDLPGYGESDKPRHVLQLPELADFLCFWMDANQLERATMLGNSFGCQIIAEFAVCHPDRLERVILQAPTIDPRARNIPELLWRFALNAPSEKVSQLPLQLYDYWLAGWWRVVRTFQIALADRIETKLPYIRVPALVVRGEKDPVVSQQWAEEVVSLLPRARLAIVSGAAHTMNYSAPMELVGVVREFLSTTERIDLQK